MGRDPTPRSLGSIITGSKGPPLPPPLRPYGDSPSQKTRETLPHVTTDVFHSKSSASGSDRFIRRALVHLGRSDLHSDTRTLDFSMDANRKRQRCAAPVGPSRGEMAHALLPPGGPLDAVVGQDAAKAVLVEASLLPLLLPPEALAGVRRPPVAVLLHGPPGAHAQRWGVLGVTVLRPTGGPQRLRRDRPPRTRRLRCSAPRPNCAHRSPIPRSRPVLLRPAATQGRARRSSRARPPRRRAAPS